MSGGGSTDVGRDWRESVAALRRRLRSLDTVHVVVAIAIVAVFLRLVLLGARTAHWDEARVGYWILHTIETGDFAYRRIIHGPFLQHVNHVIFPLVGASDFTMRLPVALLGGLFPLAALLFREHLADDETVALALFLGFNAVLLYYSRFMRSDLPVALFMFAGLGLLVRFYDTRRFRYLYGMAALAALGFGAKENAAVYLLTWIGGTVVLAEYALFRPRGERSGLDVLRATWLGTLWTWLWRLPGRVEAVARRRVEITGDELERRLRGLYDDAFDPDTTAGTVARWLVHPVGTGLLFLAVIVVLYAPRGDGAAGLHYQVAEPANRTIGLYKTLPRIEGEPGLYGSLLQPGALPDLVDRTLTDTGNQFYEWFAQSSDPGCDKDTVLEGWLCYLGQYLEVMWHHARVLSVFAVLGFLYERYGRVRSRNLVMFASYAGFVSVLGYPLGTDVFGAWLVVHALVPLAIPAAVAVAGLYRWGRSALDADDDVRATVAGVVLALLVLQVAAVNVGAVYTNDTAHGNGLVQYAQPADDLDPVVGAMERAAAEGRSGADVVLYYGVNDSERDERDALVAQFPVRQDGQLLTEPACAEWFNTLPLPWYWTVSGANVTCDDSTGALANRATEQVPGVLITVQADPTVPTDRLEAAGYDRRAFQFRSYGRTLVVFVHERVGWG